MTKQNSASWLAWYSGGTLFRVLLALVPVLLYATSCTEGPGGGLTDPGDRSVRVGLVPQYHYSGAPFAPVARVRLTVLRLPGNDTLFTEIQPLADPNADSWDLKVQFDLPPGVASADVVILLELLSNAGVEWSGKTSPIAVTPAETSRPTAPISLFQGPPENLEVQGVQITTAPATLVEGDTAALVALISPAGRGQLFWASLDTLVGTVSPTGVVRTRRDGTLRIKASAGPREDTAVIAVRQRPASVRIQPDTARASSVGQAVTFTAAVLDPRGAPIAGASVNWSSLHPAIAESQGNGQYVARANGTATIVATSTTATGVSGNARFIVAQQPASIELDVPTSSFDAFGVSVRFTATAFDAAGMPIPNAAFTWSSANPTVATVDAGGNVTAVGNGLTRITVATANGSSAAIDVTVQQVLAAIVVTPAPHTFTALGDTVRFAARPTDRNGNAMAAAITWSSSDPAVVTVDASGLARSVTTGNARVLASSGAISGAAEVSVAPVFTRLEITPALDTLRAVGATLAFSARGFDRNGNLAAAQPSWSSSDPAVATIDASGTATATGPGSTTITARAGAVQATATLVVVQRAASVHIVPDSLPLPGAGTTGRFTASVRDARGADIPGARVTWSSLEPNLATVDSTGLVTGVRRGMARIVASSAGAADTARAYVAGTSVQITPDTLRLSASFDTASFTATVRNAAGQVLAQRLVWTSLQPLIAQVDSTGRVTALNAGTASIVAAALDAADTAVVVFRPVATRITITPAADTVEAGETVSLSANAFDARGVSVPVELTWSSADTTIASVDQQGNVTGRLAGLASITVAAGSMSAHATVLVTGEPDLVILDFTVSRDSVSVGDSVLISMAVRNAGTAASGPTALVLRAVNAATGGVLRDSVMPVPSLPPSGMLSVSRWVRIGAGFAWPPAIALIAIIDPADVVDESNETNNSQQRGPVYIRSMAPPPATGLPADIVLRPNETVQLTSAIPGRTWSLFGSPYTATVDTAGNVYAYGYGSVRVVASNATAADTTLIWVVPAGYTRAWVGGGANLDFGVANNWVPSGTPAASDHLFIPDCGVYNRASCAYPVLSADVTVASVSTGGIYWYTAAELRTGSAFALHAERVPGSQLGGEARTAYLARRAEHDSARAADGGRALRAVNRDATRASVRTEAAAARGAEQLRRLGLPKPSAASYEYHVDLNGRTLTVTAGLPDYASMGSATSLTPGTLRVAGTGAAVVGLNLFGNLEITGANAVVGAGSASIDGNVTVTGSVELDVYASGNLVLNGGSIYTDNSIDFGGTGTFTNGTVTLDDAGLYIDGNVTITGTTFNLDPWGWTGFYGNVTANNPTLNVGSGEWLTYGSMTMSGGVANVEDGYFEVGDYSYNSTTSSYDYFGDLVLENGATLHIMDWTWAEVFGNFVTRTSALFRQSGYADLEVYGDVSFDGASTAGMLNSGELYIYGDLVVGNSTTGTAFAPGGEHWTEFGYSGIQGLHTVQMANPGPTGNRLHHVENYTSQDTLRFTGPTWITGDLENSGRVEAGTLDVAGTVWNDGGHLHATLVTLGGALHTSNELGSLWNVAKTVFSASNLNHLDGDLTGNAEILGTPDLWELKITGNLDFRGTGALTADGGGVVVDGTVRVLENAQLAVNASHVQIGGGLETGGAGKLLMSGTGVITAGGNVNFAGGANSLTGGVLNVRGNLSAGAGLLGASGTHEIDMEGTATNQQLGVADAFQDLRFSNAQGVQILTDVTVSGHFAANGSTVRAGAIHHVRAKNATLANFTASRVWLDLGNTTDATAVDVSNLSFTGFQSGDAVPAQLRISLPGTVDMARNGFAFDAVPGGSYIELHGSTVKFHFNTATPTTPPASRFSGTGRIYYNGIGVLNPLPNLRAHGWILSPGFPFQYGDSITLQTITGNPGTIATPASTVRTQIRDAATSAVLVEWTNPVPALSPGQLDTVANRTRVNESWPTSAAIHVFVDPGLLVTEDNEGDNTSLHSNIAVTQPAPRLLMPFNGTEFHHFPRTVEFSWTTFSGAVGYELEWAFCSGTPAVPENCPGWTEYTPVSVTATTYKASHVGDQTGRWRVRAVLSAGSYSAWAPYQYFNFRTYVSITPGNATIGTASSTQLTATVTGLANTGLVWRSENALVASVNSTGQVYGVAPGVTTIRATSVTDSTIYATATITVTTGPTTTTPTTTMVPARSSDPGLVDGRWQPAAVGRSVGSGRE